MQTETSRYLPRLQALPVHISEASSLLSSLGVTAPLGPSQGIRNILMTQLVLFNVGSLRVAHDLTEAAELLFRNGRITSSCLQLRLLLEFWGATAFAGMLCDRVRDAVDLEDDTTLSNVVVPINRLIAGSRIPVRLPKGGETSTRSYNVMKFIQHLERCDPGTEQAYEFLCEVCHPSFVQQSYFWMMGSSGDNWNNEVFRKHASALLERLVLAGEKATLGLTKATEHVTRVARPFVVTSK